jgi:hypothetical protein
VTLSIYFYDFNARYGFDFWYYQFTASPALDSITGIPVYLHPFLNLVAEHRRFFHNPKVIIFSVFLIFTLVIGARHIWKKYHLMTVYTILLFLLTAMVAMHKSRQYLLIYFPFLAIFITKTYSEFILNRNASYRLSKQKLVNGIFYFLVIIYLAGSTYYNYGFIPEKFSPAENARVLGKHLDKPKDQVSVIAPMTFIFNEIEYYERIQGEVCYTEMQKEEDTIYGAGFLDKATEYGIDYIYLSRYYREKLGLRKPERYELTSNWQVLEDTDEFIILERKHP